MRFVSVADEDPWHELSVGVPPFDQAEQTVPEDTSILSLYLAPPRGSRQGCGKRRFLF